MRRLAEVGGWVQHFEDFEHVGLRLDIPMGRHAIEGMGSDRPGLLARIDGLLAGAS